MNKVIWADSKDREELERKFGNYNDAPPGFKEISESEFAMSDFFQYYPTHIGMKQIIGLPNERHMLTVTLYYMPQGNGFGMAYVSEKIDYKEGQRIVVEPARVRYFRFGCNHQFREYGPEEAKEKGLGYSSGNCMHNYICDKCGYTECVDSSD